MSNKNNLDGLRVALVFPNVALEKTAALMQNVHALGPIPPMSLIYAAGVLEDAGATVCVVDATGEGLSMAQVVERVRDFGPEVVGYTLATLDFAFSMEWIGGIRAQIDVPVVVGGIHLSQYPIETLTHECIDWGVVTDAEVTLPHLLATWRRGGRLDRVPGIAYRLKDGTVKKTKERPTWERVDDTPWPARHLLNLDAYWSIVSREKRFTALMTGFGCPFSCVFCVLNGVVFRQRSPASIADEMEHCYTELGIKEFDFFDPNFSFGKERVHAICDAIRARGLQDKVIWSARARADTVDQASIRTMAAAGCVRICFGIESGDERVLRNAEKWQGGADQLRDAIGWSRKVGMEVMGFFTLGNPGETHATMDRTKELILSLDLDLIQVSPIFMLPGSPMYDTWLERTEDDFWRRHTLDCQPVPDLPFLDTDLTTEHLKAAALDIYRSFYFRPRQILRGLRRFRSATDVKRAWAAAKGLMSS